MWNALVSAYAVLAIGSVIPFAAVYGISTMQTGDKKRAMGLAMDMTTIFLIGIVSYLLNRVFGIHMGFYIILLFMLLGAGLIGNAQYRVRGKVDSLKLFRAIWRLSFFGLAALYVLFMLIEIVRFLASGEWE
ncbi:DUF3397 domain-containing protein [Cohnella hashimotonis]|uniref:DUF3397 domain-containing protein n=1 Tax=Cohnella hashimotonis TaxID=2826895 RepID=A0ABT6TL87_9BACL|nr:DUF3397 domain-containing protein [Cohnella hashimotonis]MDI4646572.1 DUF3397 domain-containing protein [Cohnella hashimotonis]